MKERDLLVLAVLYFLTKGSGGFKFNVPVPNIPNIPPDPGKPSWWPDGVDWPPPRPPLWPAGSPWPPPQMMP